MFGTINEPIVLLAGDVNEDDKINMADVVKMTSAFSTNSTDEQFDSSCDLNIDNQVNMIDVIILAKNFNKTSDDYQLPFVNSFQNINSKETIIHTKLYPKLKEYWDKEIF